MNKYYNHTDRSITLSTSDNNNNTYNDTQTPQSQLQQHGKPQDNARRPVPSGEEERRRLEAARQAAIRSGRVSEDELRRRRAEQQILNAGQPQSELRGTAPGDVSHGQIRPQTRASVPTRRQKHRQFHLNAGALLFVILIAGVLGVSLHQISQNDVERQESAPYTFNEAATVEELESDIAAILGEDSETGDTGEADVPGESAESGSAEQSANAGENADSGNTADSAAKTEEGSLPGTMSVENSRLDEGTLILVNYDHPYAGADSVPLTNAYDARAAHQGKLKISSTDAAMEVTAFAALEELVKGMETDTDCDDLMINSGHRTIAEQQRIYDSYLASNGQEYVDAYVALPGYSEHHTGLACDLTFYLDEGYSVPISDHEFGFWMNTCPVNYGFIRRYPEGKEAITHISYEPWHFRYVGLPHAYACTALDLCLEEYIAYLKNYTADGKMLFVKTDGSVAEAEANALPTTGGWLIYFVPMAEGSETTFPVPQNGSVEVSGNNEDGFIVTVKLP